MTNNKSRFTSDRRAPSGSSWADVGDWEAGTAENVDITTKGLVGRPPLQSGEASATEFYGFENGDWSNNWVDASQSSSSIRVTDSRAYGGLYSLDVSSYPGTSTVCRAWSTDNWLGAAEYRLQLNKYKGGGGYNAHTFGLLNVSNTNQQLYIRASSYATPYVILIERDASGSIINTWVVRDTTDTPVAEWFAMSVDVRGPDTVVATVDGDSVSAAPDLDWTGVDVRVEISANGWGGGHRIHTAADNVVVNVQND